MGLPALLLALSIGSGLRSIYANSSQATIASPEQAITKNLRLDEQISGMVSAKECHLSRIELTAGQFVALTIEHPGFDAMIEISGPDRRTRVQYGRSTSSPTSLSFISDVSGDYQLRLCSSERQAADSPYTVSIREIRPPTARDGDLIAAERSFAAARQLQADCRAETSREAIAAYMDALSHSKAAGAQEDESRTLTAIGDTHHTLGELEEAETYYHRALDISKVIHDVGGQGRATNGLASLHLQRGKIQEARVQCDIAISLFQKVKDREGLARSFNLVGDILGWKGDLQTSMEYYNRSLPLWRNLDHKRGQAQTLLSMGYNHSDLGDDLKAIEHYNQALGLWDAVNDRRGRALTLHALGYSSSNLGDKQKALNLFHRARDLIEPTGDDAALARLVNSLGRVYRELHQYQDALEYYKIALRLFQEVDFRRAEGDCFFNISRCYSSLGDMSKAESFCLRALDIYHSLSDLLPTSLALRELGNIRSHLGDQEAALAYYKRALSLNRETKNRREEAYTLNDLGRFYHSRGEYETALELYDDALLISKETINPVAESATRYNIACVKNDLANPKEALSQIETAIKIIDSLRSKVASHALRSSYYASLHEYHMLHIDLLMQMHEQQPSEGWHSLAFQASEHARARSLLDSLGEARVDIRQGVDPKLLERERTLRQTLNTKAARQIQMLNGGVDEAKLAAIEKEVQELTKEYEQAQALIRSKSPRYAALTQPQPLSLEEIQRELLDDETLLLEYALGKERSFLWAVTNKSHSSHELPPRAEIEEVARLVYKLMTARQPLPGDDVRSHRTRVKEADSNYWPEAGRLSEMVLGPVAGQLGSKRLLVVSDGALQYLPFGALPVPGSEETAHAPVPLVVEHEMVSMPSASTLAVLRTETEGRKAASKSVAVLADPVFELDDPRLSRTGQGRLKVSEKDRTGSPHDPSVVSDLTRALRDVGFSQEGRLRIPRLPSTRLEAKAIIAAAPSGAGFEAVDFRASLATATDPTLAEYRIVHFATHGLLNNEHPELSGIILSMVDENGRPQNGFLRLHDIYNLDLPVDLVVLSACNSGLGKNVRGEGLVGIVRGFMYAGAERVVASLWKVDDEATGELMKVFYRSILKQGATPAAALRKAQVTMWRQKRWQSPFYWAAFVLQGEWM